MKKLINQIFLIPILFLFFGIASFGILYTFFVNDIANKEFEKTKKVFFESEKKILKRELLNIVEEVDSLRTTTYEVTNKILSSLLKIVINNYYHFNKGEKKFFTSHFNKHLFFYISSKDFTFPKLQKEYIKIGDKEFLIVNLKNHSYLAVEKRVKNKIIGIAFDKEIIDYLVKDEIKNLVKKVNKNDPINYVAIGEIYDWNRKSGVFGEIFYHPITKFIGKKLNLDKTDSHGFNYRMSYYECLKKKDICFVSYYFLNPKTNKDERKYSYFIAYRPYNLVFAKGVYFSQISKRVDNISKEIVNDAQKLFFSTFILLLGFVFISFIFAYFISKRIMNKILEDFNTLSDEYETSKRLLYEKIYFDKVTNLPNQVKLKEDIGNFESLIILDIDDFASIDNLYGFSMGDDILRCVARFLKNRFKYVYKVGSDEFAIPLKVKINSKVLNRISKWEIECDNFTISFKIGASNVKENLFVTAENALKIAQKKNLKFLLYDEELRVLQQERFNRLKQLRKILKSKGVVPHYQCVVDNARNVKKYEALMRLEYEKEILSPFMFMDLIKEAKLYHEFSRLMIKKVFKDVILYDIDVSINLSFIDIVEEETRDLIINLLETFLIGEKITFEILESESIKNFEEVKSFIKEVKKYNSKIAIDDFGSGYSNLINILSLEPDYIKLDGSLVKNVSKKEYLEIIKLIVEFANKFNIVVIAEFVENEKIFNILSEVGVNCYQGYYFCKPVRIEEIVKK